MSAELPTLKINPALPNLLYVDDEVNNLISFTAAFRKIFNVFPAQSAREGMSLLKMHNMSLIVTDQRMPEMTGVQFLEAIIPEHPDPIRMVLTGYSDVESIIRAINTGRVFRYITKPWVPEELKMILETGLKVYQLEQVNRELVSQLQKELLNQKRVLNIFQKYLSEDIVSQIAHADSELFVPQEETRVVTVLFSDIRRSTELISKLDPKIAIKYLNTYFTLMSECVKQNKGTINKFLGDGILALFGAPTSYIDNQYNAVSCGIDMIEKLKEFNRDFSHLVGRDIEIGIGINTGEVIAGTLGSAEKIEYTVIGDPVNIASRIADLTKDRLNVILISESTYSDCKDLIDVVELPLQSISGKEEKIKVYQVVGRKTNN